MVTDCRKGCFGDVENDLLAEIFIIYRKKDEMEMKRFKN